jgi:hypothetical protein
MNMEMKMTILKNIINTWKTITEHPKKSLKVAQLPYGSKIICRS